MKTYSVTYDLITNHETIVKAKSLKEAQAKVEEVIGYPIEIKNVREINAPLS